jgi:hypothetical protein
MKVFLYLTTPFVSYTIHLRNTKRTDNNEHVNVNNSDFVLIEACFTAVKFNAGTEEDHDKPQ